jgi:hypothetical protein
VCVPSSAGFVVAIIALVAFAPAAALAAPAPGDTVQEHDGGYLRFETGFGYLAFPGRSLDNRLAAGSTELVTFAAGGAVARDLILFGSVETEGVNTFASGTTSTGMFSIGPGVAYFADGRRLYLAAALRLTELVSFATDADESGGGIGLEAVVGDQLQISRRWALGVAGRFSVARVSFPAEPITLLGVALLLSVTYN